MAYATSELSKVCTCCSHPSGMAGNGNLPAGPDAASAQTFVFGTAMGQADTCRAAQPGSPDKPGLAGPGNAMHVNVAVAHAQRRATHRARARRGAASASFPSAAPGVLRCLDAASRPYCAAPGLPKPYPAARLARFLF